MAEMPFQFSIKLTGIEKRIEKMFRDFRIIILIVSHNRFNLLVKAAFVQYISDLKFGCSRKDWLSSSHAWSCNPSLAA